MDGIKRFALIAGEHAGVFRRCSEALRARLAEVAPELEIVLVDDHQAELGGALAAGDHGATLAQLKAAAHQLQVAGRAALAVCSWRLQEHADALAQSSGGTVIRLERMLGQTLAAAGYTSAGFLAHSEAYLRPEVRYRMYGEYETDLLCPNEDVFEYLDRWAMDHGVENAAAKDLQRMAERIQSAWRYLRVDAVVAERRELADFARQRLGYRPVLDLESVWVEGLVRLLSGEPDLKPKLVERNAYAEAISAAQAALARALGCDTRSIDVDQDRQGEPVLIAPDLPGAQELPDWIEGVAVRKPGASR